jgi:glycosyltransferase involved in cell wall biosynthesis
VFILVRRMTQYLEFAMPVKLFEALGHGLPLLISPGTAASRFVEEEGVGWVVRDGRALAKLVDGWRRQPAALDAVYAAVGRSRVRNTWCARARQIAATLTQ